MAVLPFPAFPGAAAFAGLGRKRASDGGTTPPVDPPVGTRPTSLPVLTAPGVKVRAWYDFTDAATLTVEAGTAEVSAVANKVTGVDALAPLATVNEWGPPTRWAGANGTLDALDFNVEDRMNFLTATGPGRPATGGVTALVIYSRKGWRKLDAYDDDPDRQGGQSLGYWPIAISQRFTDGDFIQDIWNVQTSPVLHEVGAMGSPTAPLAGWVLQRWLPSQAPISGLNVGGQAKQTLRSWWSGAKDAPTTVPTNLADEGGTGTLDVGSTGADWQWANPSKDLLHEVIIISGVPNETDIATLKAWASARLIGAAGADTAPPVDPPPETGNAWDPPATWAVALDDHFDTVAPTNHGLDPAAWKHTDLGTAPAHNGSSYWDGGDGLSIHDSAVELKARKVDGTWYVTGFMQGASADPNSPLYHPGYGEFHLRMRARTSVAHAPGIGWYALLWPASNLWTSEIDILETPGADKNRGLTSLHWNITDTSHDQMWVLSNIDLTQWHVWDVRRTYRQVNGQTVATLRVWIDGVELKADDGTRPWGWDDNAQNTDNMVFGAASYVAPWDAEGWYGLTDDTTPAEISGFIDRLQIWAPQAGGGGGNSLSLEYPNGAPVAGAKFSFTAVSTGYSTLQWAVFNGASAAYTDWHPQAVGAGGRTPITTDITLQPGDYVQLRGLNDPASVQYTPQATGTSTGGGGTGGGGTPGAVMVTLQGQSNAYFLWDRGSSAGTLQNTVGELTGLGDGVQWNAGQNVTLYGGTGTYNIPANANENWLLSNAGAPSTWANNDIMQTAIDSVVAARQGIAPDRPWLFIRMHSEYDQKLGSWPKDSSEVGPYPAANRELIKRFRDAAQRSAALMPVFYFHVPYAYGTGDGFATLESAWQQDVGNAAMNAYWGAGMEWAATSQDDGSHWDTPSSDFAAALVGMRLARWLHDNGYSPNDLSWLPTLGPRIVAVKRVAGNAGAVDVVVQHDKGGALVIPSGVDWGAFFVNDNGTQREATGGTLVNATTLRLTLDSNLTGATSGMTFTYGSWSSHLGLGKVVTDDWGSVAKPGYTPSWIGSINMPLQRTRGPIQVTSA